MCDKKESVDKGDDAAVSAKREKLFGFTDKIGKLIEDLCVGDHDKTCVLVIAADGKARAMVGNICDETALKILLQIGRRLAARIEASTIMEMGKIVAKATGVDKTVFPKEGGD